MNSGTKFLAGIKTDINKGKYDEFLTLPFISRDLIFSSFKNLIDEKLKNNHAPVLNEEEIKIGLDDARQTAVETFNTFLKKGIIVKNGEDYELSEMGMKMLQ